VTYCNIATRTAPLATRICNLRPDLPHCHAHRGHQNAAANAGPKRRRRRRYEGRASARRCAGTVQVAVRIHGLLHRLFAVGCCFVQLLTMSQFQGLHERVPVSRQQFRVGALQRMFIQIGHASPQVLRRQCRRVRLHHGKSHRGIFNTCHSSANINAHLLPIKRFKYQRIHPIMQRASPSSSRWTKSVVAGGCAGICYWLVAFPFDGTRPHASMFSRAAISQCDKLPAVIKARLMAAPDGARPPTCRPSLPPPPPPPLLLCPRPVSQYLLGYTLLQRISSFVGTLVSLIAPARFLLR
jgi:hypothetical protein